MRREENVDDTVDADFYGFYLTRGHRDISFPRFPRSQSLFGNAHPGSSAS